MEDVRNHAVIQSSAISAVISISGALGRRLPGPPLQTTSETAGKSSMRGVEVVDIVLAASSIILLSGLLLVAFGF
jgi:hypothetical protein